MAEIGNVTVKVDAVITDEQYYEAMSAVSAANEYIAALEAENARLRELVEEDSEQLDKWQKKAEYYSQLSQLAEAENAKLRKLVKEAHLCMVNEGCCEDCYATYGECPIEMGMRELGIEVDE